MLRLRSRVGKRGQMVVPKPMRDRAGLRDGDEVILTMDDGPGFHVEPARSTSVVDELLAIVPPEEKIKGPIDAKKLKAILEEQYEEELRDLGG